MAEGIIIADNDVLIRGILRSMLASVGQRVFPVASGWEAIGVAARMQADLVLLDLDMPGLNGLLTCRKLRCLPGYHETPVVILSAFDSQSAQSAAKQVGATRFVSKPFQPASLLNLLCAFLKVDTVTQAALSRGAERARGIAAPALPDANRDTSWPPRR